MDGYQRLANAIIVKAVKDYRKSYKRRLKFPYDETNNKRMRKLEKFFFSEYFGVLSNLDGRKLLEKIRSRIK